MTIADLIKSLIDSSKERMKTPIVGSFLCSFLIFNWKPIFILFFSNATAECRIDKVNLYFNNWTWIWSLVVPFAMVAVYTFLIPMLMVWIDEKLRPTKEKRITGIYKTRDFTSEKKKVSAFLEYEVKQAESGNKNQEDLMAQLEDQKREHEQIVESFKYRITELTDELGETTETLKNSIGKNQNLEVEKLARINSQKLFINIINKLMALDEIELRELMNMPSNTEIVSSNLPDYLLEKYVSLGLIIPNSQDAYILTTEGADFLHVIRNIDNY